MFCSNQEFAQRKARIPALTDKARIPALAGNLWIEQQIAQTMDVLGQTWNLYRHHDHDHGQLFIICALRHGLYP